MPDFTFRERAVGAVHRIDESLFATQEERSAAHTALGEIQRSQTVDDVYEEVGEINGLLSAVMARESGRSQLASQNRKSIEESLATLEDRLIEEIKERKSSQRRDLVILISLFTACVIGTLATGIIIGVHPARSSTDTVSGSVGLAAGIVCCLISARLIQNSRESLERLDEKIVAVRFLRMALHPSWATEVGGTLIRPALIMFGQHFAPSSTPLGADDTKSFLSVFRNPLDGNSH